MKKTSNRLEFASSEALQDALKTFYKAENKEAVLEEVIKTYTINGNQKRFKSLLSYTKELELSKESEKENGISARSISKDEIGPDSLEALVPDPAFASVLNNELEIVVDNILYKVTPYGTFYTHISNESKLHKILLDEYEAENEQLVDEKLYLVAEDIYRYDTYGGEVAHTYIQPIDLDGGKVTSGRISSQTCSDYYQPYSYTTYPYNLPKDEYCKFKTYSFGAKTIVGKGLENLFGTNSSLEERFDSKHRVQVKLYSYNYIVFSSIGLKAKFQKKGWTGIWDKKDCPKLVVGWDGLIFETPFRFAKPYEMPTLKATAISKEVLNFINFSIPVKSFTDFDIVFNDKSIADYTALQKLIDKQAEAQLATIIKKVWEASEKELAYESWEVKQDMVKAFRQVYPDKFTTVLSRYEEARTNSGEIDLMFDFNTIMITYNGPIHTPSNKIVENVLKNSLKNKAISYNIVKASIYGAGNYNNQWKGIRIVQD